MKIGKNTGRYALGILSGLQSGDFSGGLRTMLAIQQERGQKKHQEKLVDRLVAGLSKNASGGSPGQTFKAPKDWNKDTLKSPTGKPQDPPPIGTPIPQAMINREQLIAGERKMPQHVFESIQRQYKGGKDYTIEDKKNVINWYKQQQA
tara:strand:+ start:3226 stop:3669 length:444 start_codon:yes stop_codon:yes gene_type:complete